MAMRVSMHEFVYGLDCEQATERIRQLEQLVRGLYTALEACVWQLFSEYDTTGGEFDPSSDPVLRECRQMMHELGIVD